MTQIEAAKQGIVTDAMKHVGLDEGLDVEEVRQLVADGKVVIPHNVHHKPVPLAIGERLRTKVNANIGTSPDHVDEDEEWRKLDMCVRYKADTIMDLSTGGNLDYIREEMLRHWRLPIGTVPIYGVANQLLADRKLVNDMDPEMFFEEIQKQAEQGVDYMTLHCGVTLDNLRIFIEQERVCGMVSRGGSLLARWMAHNKAENPLYAEFDRVLDILREHDVTLSAGDGMRPGAIADAGDDAQWGECSVLGELTKRAWDAGVQVMIEGPGHVPVHEVGSHMKTMKRLCFDAPIYVLGPLTCDVGAGYDHITGAIGGAVAAAAGADMLCYVTPAEHLRLPDSDDVRNGIIATRIAAHSGDLAKGVNGAAEWDWRMSKARKELDWETMYELAIDGDKTRELRIASEDYDKGVCTMCGDFCAIVSSSAAEKDLAMQIADGDKEKQKRLDPKERHLSSMQEELGSIL